MICLSQAQTAQLGLELGEVVSSHGFGGGHLSKVVDVVQYLDPSLAQMPGH